MIFDTDKGTLREFPRTNFPSPKKGDRMIIKFTTDNAAFEDKENETVRIIRKIADRIEEGVTEGPVMDSNGNKVGYWEL